MVNVTSVISAYIMMEIDIKFLNQTEGVVHDNIKIDQ